MHYESSIGLISRVVMFPPFVSSCSPNLLIVTLSNVKKSGKNVIIIIKNIWCTATETSLLFPYWDAHETPIIQVSEISPFSRESQFGRENDRDLDRWIEAWAITRSFSSLLSSRHSMSSGVEKVRAHALWRDASDDLRPAGDMKGFRERLKRISIMTPSLLVSSLLSQM